MPHTPISQHMTASPHTIGINQTLSVAHLLMTKHHIRHLPVLDTGKLVGLVSLRDLHFIETLRDVDPTVVTVDEAMTAEPYTVEPTARLSTVVATMAKHKYGSAIVVDADRVVGVFTTIDALTVLASRLEPAKVARPTRSRARSA